MDEAAPFRSSQPLDGLWSFRFGDGPAWHDIAVPGPWQAAIPALRDRFGTGHYRRWIDLPATADVRRIRFGAVSEHAVVRLAGHEIGRHAGGYLPFTCDVPEDLQGRVLLEVEASLPGPDSAEHPFAEYPHGKQSWYGPLGGIWQSVALEVCPPTRIDHVAIRAGMEGQVAAEVSLTGDAADLLVRIEVHAPSGAVLATGDVALDGSRVRWDAAVAEPQLWSHNDPVLHHLVVTLLRDGTAIDRVVERFGFRSIEARDGRLLLNGEPLYLRGALDQDYYPEGICTPPGTAFLEDQLRKAKHLGLNCLRCHIKVPDPRYYEVADRLGMLIWTEIPNVEHLSEDAARRLRETFEGILHRDGNHPSIFCWTIINEDWGTRLVEDTDHRAWLAETYDWAKALDPTRLVVDNSACLPNFHVKTDLDDFHYYRGIPERRREWDALTAEFAARADWSFSSNGDAVRSGREPLIVSEFGLWGLPQPRLLRDAEGREPWWMESGPFWGDGAAYPHGIETRFEALKLDAVFGSLEGFVEAAQWHQFQGLKYQIESMRAHPEIMGYVITELTDVHWEANGLLDLNRNPRVFHDRFREVNADCVILPRLRRWAFWAGEELTIPIDIACGGLGMPAGCRLEWGFGNARGSVGIERCSPLEISSSSAVTLAMPDVAGALRLDLTLRLVDPDGRELARNSERVSVYPRAEPSAVTVASPDPALHAYLGALGFDTAGLAEADVLVTRDFDAADVEAIRRGRRMLLLADGKGTARATLRTDPPPREPPFQPIVDGVPGLPAATHHRFPGLGLVERHGTLWRGDWIGNFSWVRRDGTFAAIPGGPMLDLSFDRVVPHHVLTGMQAWEYPARVFAGVVVGWVHKPAAFLCERPFGKGRLVATTFRLTEDEAGHDPVAATLMRAAIAQATSS